MRRVLVVLSCVGLLLMVTLPAVAASMSGTNSDDALTGTPSADSIHGNNGQDRIFGLGGTDLLYGDNGDDVVSGGDDGDTLSGGNGQDQLAGDAGSDILDGDNGDDTLRGNAGDDLLYPDLGSESLHGDAGNDVFANGRGGASIWGGDGNDIIMDSANGASAGIHGDAGDDIVAGLTHGNPTTIDGGAGSDTCYGRTNDTFVSCEAIVKVSAAGAAATLAQTAGPAQDAIFAGTGATLSFTALHAGEVYCFVDDASISRCDSGSFTASGLAAGDHTIGVVALPNARAAGAQIVRRFTLTAPVASPAISTFTSPSVDTLTVSGQSLAGVTELRLHTADGQLVGYTLPDPRVEFSEVPQNTFTIADVNLGREVITQVDALIDSTVVASKTGSVAVASSITLDGAASNSPESLTISGTHLTAVDTIVLTHDGGALTVALSSAGVTVSDSQVVISAEALGGLHVTQIDAVRLMDGAEVMASLVVDVTIANADSTPPAITVPADFTVEAMSSEGSTASFETAALDAVDGVVDTFCDHASGDTFPLGDTVVTCTANDLTDNVAEEHFTITVADTVGPVISVPEHIDAVSADATGSVENYDVEAFDTVDGNVGVTCTPPSGSKFSIGVTNVTCQSTDSRGNTSAASFTLTVHDVGVPELTLVSTPDVTVAVGAPVFFTVDAVDAVSGVLTAVCNPASGSTLSPGPHEVHCEAVDAAGNVGSLDFTLTVTYADSTPPAITVPADFSVEATSSEGAPATFNAVAMDAVDGVVHTFCDYASGDTFPLGDTTVTCTAFDLTDNASQERFTITVVDTVGPVISVPEPIDAVSDDPTGSVENYGVDALDIVDGSVEAICTPPSHSKFAIGETIVTCQSTDAHGNTSSASFTLTVRDIGVPELTLTSAPDADVSDPAGGPVLFTVEAVDAVSGTLPAVCNPATGSTLSAGAHAVHCEAVDAAGNVGSLDFTLTVHYVDPFTAAEDVLSSSLPQVLAEGYDSHLPMGVLKSMPSADRVYMNIVDRSGNPRRVYAIGNFGYTDGDGTVLPIDTTLARVAGGYAPRGVGYDVTLPVKYSDGMRWGLGGALGDVTAVPVAPNLGARDGRLIAGADHVMYPSAWPDTDVVDTTKGDGVAEHLIARSPDAPQAYSWKIGHPIGTTLRIADSRLVVDFATGGSRVLSFGPLARDASGQQIAASYRLDETTDGSVLSLIWNALPTALGGDLQRPVVWPIDIDPDFQFFIPDPGITGQSTPGSSDGAGAPITCNTSTLRLEYAGPGDDGNAATALTRSFTGGVSTESCTVAGPPPGADWFSFNADYHWGIKPDTQSLSLLDDEESAAVDSVGNELDAFTTDAIDVMESGDTVIDWDDNNPNGAPVGAIHMTFNMDDDDILGEGRTRAAILENVTRIYVDEIDPDAVMLPSSDELIAAGPYPISISASDAGSGCTNGTVMVTDPNGTDVFHQDFAGCNYSAMPSFTVIGDYTVSFTVFDGAGNTTDVERTITVADPIATPEDGASVSGTVDANLELGSNLAVETAQLYGTTTAGITFPIGNAHLDRGRFSEQWDTSQIQNGDVVLTLRLGAGAGATVLKAVTVTVDNAHPAAIAKNASSTDIGEGLQVVHRTGALVGTFTDIKQPGFGGITFGVSRTYNSQDPTVGAFGHGWHASWEQYLRESPIDHVVTFVDQYGHEWPFTPASGGGYSVAPGQMGRLALNPDVATAVAEPYLITYPDGHVLHFNADKRIVRESWPAGNGVNYSGLTAGAAGFSNITISDDAGHHVVVTIDAAGRATSATDSIGRTTSYEYLDDGLERVTDSENRFTAYGNANNDVLNGVMWVVAHQTQFFPLQITYEDHVTAAGEKLPRAVAVAVTGDAPRSFDYGVEGQVTDKFGDRTSISTFDDSGQLVTFTNANGDDPEYAYNDLGEVTEVIDENGGKTINTYDLLGRMTSETDPEGNVTAYSNFDTYGTPGRTENAAHEVTTRTFDGYGNKLTETTPDLQSWHYTYDAGSPLPTSTTDPVGRVKEFEYDSTGQVSDERSVEADGIHHIARNTYDDAGQRLSKRVGTAPETTYTYDGSGFVVETIDPLGNPSTFIYDRRGNLTDSYENGISRYRYDERNNRVASTDPLGHTTNDVFDQYGDKVSETDPLGHTTTFAYDKVGNELSSTDPIGRTSRTAYDPAGNETQVTLPGGVATTTDYDRNGNRVGIAHADTSSRSTTYTALEQLHTETDELGHSTTYAYDVVGRKKAVTNAEGETDKTFYDAAGLVNGVANGLDERTDYRLDPRGNVVRTTHPDTTFTSASFDDAGHMTQSANELGKSTVLSYDAIGHVLTELRPGGLLWHYTYDANGNKLTSENPEHEVTTFTYDRLNRLLTTTDAAGGMTTNVYDAVGNLKSMTDPEGKVTSYLYDDANQRSSMTDPSGIETTYTYTPRGQVETSTTGNTTTRYRYDLRDNLTRVAKGESVTSYEFDAAGNQTKQTMPDGTTLVLSYDRANRLASQVHSVRGETDWTYDQAGRVHTETSPNGVITYTRNSMGRVTRVAFPGGSTANYTYDATGNLLSNTDARGTRTNTYDDAGRIATYTTVRGRHATNTYDKAGRLIQMSIEPVVGSATRVTRTYTYDAAGRLTTFNTGHGAINYVYDKAGRLLTKTLPGLKLITYSYDEKGRMKTQQLTGQPLLTYSYDAQDRITAIDATTAGSTTSQDRYAYSTEGRLTAWWHNADASRTDYAYSVGGNLASIERGIDTPPAGTNTAIEDTQMAACYSSINSTGCPSTVQSQLKTVFGADVPTFASPSAMTGVQAQIARYMHAHPLRLRTYSHNGKGQLASYVVPLAPGTSSTITYGPTGNPDTDGTNALTYDYANRLTSHFVASAHPVTTWTSDGKMFQADSGTTLTPSHSYDYDVDGRMAFYQSNSTDVLRNEVIWDPFGVAMTYNNTLDTAAFGYYNQHGDTLALTDAQGNTTNTYAYEPWGRALGLTGPTQSARFPFLYNGRDGSLTNPTSGGVWMGARTYVPEIGRFRQADPVPAQQGTSDTAYSYAGQDPVNHVDPNGMNSETNDAPGKGYRYFDGCSKPAQQGMWFDVTVDRVTYYKWVSFWPACNYHDMCLENIWYGEFYPYANARGCHAGLKSGIRAECTERLTGKFEKRLDSCYVVAGVYEQAVVHGCKNCFAMFYRLTDDSSACAGGSSKCRMSFVKWKRYRKHWKNWPKAWGPCYDRCDR